MIEEWKDIEESNFYELSNYGNVRDKVTKLPKSFTYLKNGTYKAYCLDGKQYLAHRLVAKYFVHNTNPEKYNVVNHLEENTHNNRADNLEWTTNKDNLEYSDYANRISQKLSKFKVIQYDKNGNVIKTWSSKEACYAAGFTQVKSFFAKKGFNRWAYDSFWFAENEMFDKKRYKPKPVFNIYDKNNNLVFTGGTGDCAKFINIPIYKIQYKLRRGIKFKISSYMLVLTNAKP